jgi:lysozyme family protein
MLVSGFAGDLGAVKKAVTAPTTSKEVGKRLQAALVALGAAVGSAKLKVAVDGAIGAKTVTAVNWAFTNHVGAGQAPAQYRTGKLTLADVKGNAATLAALLETETKRRRSVAATKAGTAKVSTPTKGGTTTVTATAKASKADALALQKAVVALGQVVGSAKLKIAADGALGAKTVAAVNWAFTNHIGAGQAPAQYRTGKLTLNDVNAYCTTLTQLILTEIRRRGSVPGAAVVASTAKASKAEVLALQKALVNLGKTVGSAKLAVTADGVLGPKTVTAVNWAFINHLGAGQAPAQYRTGKLTLANVNASAATLTQLIVTEIKRRGGDPSAAVKQVPVKLVKKLPAKQTGQRKVIKTKDGRTLTVQEVELPSGEKTYEATDQATGQTVYAKTEEALATTPPPTNADEGADEGGPAPTAVAPAPAPGAYTEQPALLPPSADLAPSFMDRYKWPMLGVGAAVAIGAVVLVMRSKSGRRMAMAGAAYYRLRRRRRRYR